MADIPVKMENESQHYMHLPGCLLMRLANMKMGRGYPRLKRNALSASNIFWYAIFRKNRVWSELIQDDTFRFFTTMTIVVGISTTTTTIIVGLQKRLVDYYCHRSSHTCFYSVTCYGYRSPFNITIGIGIFFIRENSLFNDRWSQTSKTGPPTARCKLG